MVKSVDDAALVAFRIALWSRGLLVVLSTSRPDLKSDNTALRTLLYLHELQSLENFTAKLHFFYKSAIVAQLNN